MVSHNLETGQVARLGEMIYGDRIRPLVEDSQIGSFVVIDVESGEYEIDREDLPATLRLLQRHPRAVTYAVRVGYPAAYSLGGGLQSSGP